MRKTMTRTSPVESKVQPNIGTIHSKSVKKTDIADAPPEMRLVQVEHKGQQQRPISTWDAFVSELEFE